MSTKTNTVLLAIEEQITNICYVMDELFDNIDYDYINMIDASYGCGCDGIIKIGGLDTMSIINYPLIGVCDGCNDEMITYSVNMVIDLYGDSEHLTRSSSRTYFTQIDCITRMYLP